MKNIFNNLPISVESAITREDRNSDGFKDIKRLIEYIFDRIGEEIPEAAIVMRSLDYTGFHELYIQKPIICLNKRNIIIGCFACSKDYEKPIAPQEMGFTFIDNDIAAEFPERGWIVFERYYNNYDNYYKLVDEMVDVFKTFLYTGEIKEHIISKDMLE